MMTAKEKVFMYLAMIGCGACAPLLFYQGMPWTSGVCFCVGTMAAVILTQEELSSRKKP